MRHRPVACALGSVSTLQTGYVEPANFPRRRRRRACAPPPRPPASSLPPSQAAADQSPTQQRFQADRFTQQKIAQTSPDHRLKEKTQRDAVRRHLAQDAVPQRVREDRRPQDEIDDRAPSTHRRRAEIHRGDRPGVDDTRSQEARQHHGLDGVARAIAVGQASARDRDGHLEEQRAEKHEIAEQACAGPPAVRGQPYA